MDELIYRSLTGRTSRTEDRQLRAWRKSAAANEARYAELALLRRGVCAALADVDSSRKPSAHTIAGIAAMAATAEDTTSRRGAGSRWLPLLAVAATVTLAIGGLYVMPLQRQPEFRMGSGEYVSGPNETATATLADGTVVRLAPNSRLRILDSRGKREVFLSGRAFLAVAPRPDLPFRVRTALGEVVVLGTRFDVLAGDELRVVVVEGKVALSSRGDRIEVPAGQMGMVTRREMMQPVEVDVAPLVAWTGRFIAFQNTPLRDVPAELELEYGTRVVIRNSALAELTVTGWYIDRTFEEVVAIVCGVVGAQCSIRDGTATIGK